MASHVPNMASDEGVIDAAKAAVGDALIEAREAAGEVTLVVQRDSIANVLKALRDTPGLEYQQLMEIAGVDYPERTERFEVVYHLLSLTRNRRIRVKLSTDEVTPVPSVTSLWPVAGWLEREVFDMYGVGFSGNPDLRRILTDYGFEASTAQGLPADRLFGVALFGEREAGGLRTGRVAAGFRRSIS